MKYSNVRIKSEDGSQQVSCLQCSKDNNLVMVQLHAITSMAIAVFYCSKHDGRFPYMADDGSFKFIPVDFKNCILSEGERERIKIDLESYKSIATDLYEYYLRC